MFACSLSIPQEECTIRMYGIKAPTTTSTGAAAGGFVVSDLVYPPRTPWNDTSVDGFDMVKTQFDQSEWSNLTRVNFVAEIEGREVDFLIDEFEYNLSGSKTDLKFAST